MPSSAKNKVRINITVPGATPARLESVRASLKRQGVEIEAVLDFVGVITARVPRSRLATLDAGPGAEVELAGEVEIPPPDAPLQ